MQAKDYGYIELYWIPNDEHCAYYEYMYSKNENAPDNSNWTERTTKKIYEQMIKENHNLWEVIGHGGACVDFSKSK